MYKELTDEQVKERISDKLYELSEIEENGLRGIHSEEYQMVSGEYQELLQEWRLRVAAAGEHSNLTAHGDRVE